MGVTDLTNEKCLPGELFSGEAFFHGIDTKKRFSGAADAASFPIALSSSDAGGVCRLQNPGQLTAVQAGNQAAGERGAGLAAQGGTQGVQGFDHLIDASGNFLFCQGMIRRTQGEGIGNALFTGFNLLATEHIEEPDIL